MSHIITEAIIENSQLKHIGKKLPRGRIKAHIIYDSTEKKTASKDNYLNILQETAGIYKNIDPYIESRILRDEWERNAKD